MQAGDGNKYISQLLCFRKLRLFFYPSKDEKRERIPIIPRISSENVRILCNLSNSFAPSILKDKSKGGIEA